MNLEKESLTPTAHYYYLYILICTATHEIFYKAGFAFKCNEAIFVINDTTI